MLVAPAAAQTPQVAMKEGDTILGIGAVVGFQSVAITDAKVWVAVTDTTFSSSLADGVVLRNGFVTFREQTPLSFPVGSSLDEWDYIDINARGDLAQAVRIKPASGAAFDGVLWNHKTVVNFGTTISSPFLGVGSKWDQVYFVKASTSSVFIMGEVDNPALSRTRENTVMRYDIDDLGNVVGHAVLATEGMNLTAIGVTVRALGASQTAAPPASTFAVNSKGDYITFINGTSGGLVTINASSIVAREGFPAPVTGRTWAELEESRVAINDRGDYLCSGDLAEGGAPGSTWLLVKNGEKFVQSADVIPGLGPLNAQTVRAPVFITNKGDVFWRLSSANTNTFMRNLTPIVQAGITQLDGETIVKLEFDEQSFSVSPNGRFFLGNVEVPGPTDVLLFMDFGLVIDIPGCHGNPGKLAHVSGEARIGDRLVLSMDKGMAPGDIPKILFSTRKRLPGSDCGVLTGAGEIIARRYNPVAVLVLPPWDGVNPSTVTVPIPSDASLVDAVLFAQGTFRTPGTRNVRLTNGLRIEIGAP
jgi:hypothetical protein